MDRGLERVPVSTNASGEARESAFVLRRKRSCREFDSVDRDDTSTSARIPPSSRIHTGVRLIPCPIRWQQRSAMCHQRAATSRDATTRLLPSAMLARRLAPDCLLLIKYFMDGGGAGQGIARAKPGRVDSSSRENEREREREERSKTKRITRASAPRGRLTRNCTA